ncbi:hypothetical protein BB561_001375 [Smittium simulii]|uniref:Uncharacterized protein n=1 Tax=Smittium simulii TaxID=133385 RepID=A0A2T9YUV7_9FUNG|nr:hypothetical protein BB561_001375 [Smittium simulii]
MRLVRRTVFIAIFFYSLVLCFTQNLMSFKIPLLYFRPSIINKKIALLQKAPLSSLHITNSRIFSPSILYNKKKPTPSYQTEPSFIPSPILSDLKEYRKHRAKVNLSDLTQATSLIDKSHIPPESLHYSNSMAALVTVLVLVIYYLFDSHI